MNIKAKLTPKPCRLGGAITLSNIVKIIKMPCDTIRIDYLDKRDLSIQKCLKRTNTL